MPKKEVMFYTPKSDSNLSTLYVVVVTWNAEGIYVFQPLIALFISDYFLIIIDVTSTKKGGIRS